MATLIDIANAVTAGLNRADLQPHFTAEMSLLPEFELKELKTLRVTVVPRSLKTAVQNRESSGREVTIDIGVQQKTADEDRLAELLQLSENIIDVFDRKRLADYQQAICVKAENDPVYDPGHLREFRQFTSVITLTFKVL